jgi:hypothetical protein
MPNFRQGFYQIKNPHKYVGKGKPKYRSGWEMTFMMFLDNNDHVLQWASEGVSIPYRNPITGKQSMYVPDFIVTYRGRDNTMRAEMIEIKPKKQSIIEERQSQRDRAQVAINYAKWAEAQKWCKRNGLNFRVITEDQIFHSPAKKAGK